MDAVLLEALRDHGPATSERIAHALGADPDTVAQRLAELESAGRVERTGEGWHLARDPRLDDGIERMRERLGRDRR